MTKKIKDLLYDPTAIHSCDVKNEQNFAETALDQLGEHDCLLLNRLEEVVLQYDEKEIIIKLMMFHQQLLEGISMNMRSIMLKEFNGFLGRTAEQYFYSQKLYQECLQIIIEFKNQMTGRSHAQGIISQTEWVELERSLSLLSVWDERLSISANQDTESQLI